MINNIIDLDTSIQCFDIKVELNMACSQSKYCKIRNKTHYMDIKLLSAQKEKENFRNSFFSNSKSSTNSLYLKGWESTNKVLVDDCMKISIEIFLLCFWFLLWLLQLLLWLWLWLWLWLRMGLLLLWLSSVIAVR